MKYVVMFSGGIASWAAARRTVERHGAENVTLLFTDTKTEDEDLYRFLDEAAADVGAPLVRIEDGRDIWQVFRDTNFLGNSRIDPCSRVLKRELSRRWMKANTDPADTAVVLGLDWTEVHRLERSARAWQPWTVEAPMTEKPYRLRAEMMADLEDRGIEVPRLYRMGFSHNNCGGGCVKAGQGHFKQLLDVFPARYAEWENNEQSVRDHLGKDVSILTSSDGSTLTLRSFRKRLEAGQPMTMLAMMDIGGCACFEEPD